MQDAGLVLRSLVRYDSKAGSTTPNLQLAAKVDEVTVLQVRPAWRG